MTWEEAFGHPKTLESTYKEDKMPQLRYIHENLKTLLHALLNHWLGYQSVYKYHSFLFNYNEESLKGKPC